LQIRLFQTLEKKTSGKYLHVSKQPVGKIGLKFFIHLGLSSPAFEQRGPCIKLVNKNSTKTKNERMTY
jgi:hypothetical protein